MSRTVAMWTGRLVQKELPKSESAMLPGWTLDDYAGACLDEDFYKSVQGNLDTVIEDDADSIQARYIASKMEAYSNAQRCVIPNLHVDQKKARAVIAKYYYSGACAGWFCQASTADSVDQIQMHVERLSS